MEIDIKTLILFTGICHLMQFLVFLHQYKTNRNLKGIGWWLMWSGAEFTGFILMLFRGFPSLLPFIIIFQNIIVLSGTIFVYFGIMSFFDKKINFKFILPFFFSFVALHLFFYLVKNDIFVRIIIINAALSIIAFLNVISLYKNKTKSIASSTNLNILMFTVHGFIFAYRTVMIISGTPAYDMFAHTFFNYTQFFDALVVGLLWTFGFIIMLNQKLNFENTELKIHFEQIFNTSPDAALITRASDSLFIDCNEGYTKLSGFTKTEMANKSILSTNLWKNQDDRTEIVEKLKKNGFCDNYEALFQRKNGEIFTGLVSAKIIILNEIPHIISVTRDISEKKQIETALRESNEKYKELADLLPQIVFESDENGKLTFVNKHAYKILGYPEGFDIKSLNSIDLYVQEDKQRAIENIKQRILDNLENKNEYTMKRYDNTLINVLVYSNPIFKDNKPVGLRGIIIDITNIKNVEEELKIKNEELVKLNSIKDKLFSIIGHDLRSPFNAILGFTDLLQKNIHNYSIVEIENWIKLINIAGLNAYKLLENLLSWTKTQTGQIQFNLTKVDLYDIIQDTINLSLAQAAEKRITLKFLQTAIHPIITDENIVNIVLRNLMTNAIKFTNTDGIININTKDNDEYIEISVSDNGIGMSEEIMSRLFSDIINQTRYGTQNEKGNGLGLAICKEFIEKLGGKIWVDSEVGIGSTFYFSLPKNIKPD